MKCNKIIHAEYRTEHLEGSMLVIKTLSFSNVIDPKQRKLSFWSNEKSVKIKDTEPITLFMLSVRLQKLLLLINLLM